MPTSRRPWRWSATSASRRPSPSNTRARPGTPAADHGRAGGGSGEGRPPRRSSRRCCATSRPRFNRSPRRPDRPRCCSPARAATPARSAGRTPWLQAGACRRACRASIGAGGAGANRSPGTPTPLPGRLSASPRRNQGETSRLTATSSLDLRASNPARPDRATLDHAAIRRQCPAAAAATASMTGTWRGSSRCSACAWRPAATGSPSRAGRNGRDMAEAALLALWKRLERGQRRGHRRGRGRAAHGRGRAPNRANPACRCATCRRSAPASGAIAPRSPGPGRLHASCWPSATWCSASARPAPARPTSRWRRAWPLLQAGTVDRIVLSRPAVEAGERLGFLPGDMKEKVDPYLRPLYDALHDMLPAEQVARRMDRGRDRDRAARLHARPHPGACLRHPRRGAEHDAGADEDVPDPHRRGLAHGHHRRPDPGRPAGRPAVRASPRRCGSLEGVEGIAVARFAERDVVSHPLVARIVAAYGRADDQSRAKKERYGTGK